MQSRYSNAARLGICICVSVLVLVTAFACDSRSPQERAGIITPEEFTTLQGVRAQLGPVIEDLSKAIDPAVPQAERRARVAAVVKKYEKEMPRPSIGPTAMPENPDEITDRLEDRLRGTLTGDLAQMDKSVSWKVDGGIATDAVSAWYVANSYLRVIDSMYGLDELEEYVLQHTLDEGTRINPSDPPDNMSGNQSMGFGGSGFTGGGGSVSVNIMYGSDGKISYAVGLRELGGEYRAATVADIEARFVLNAAEALREGDSLLLERTRL